MKDIHDLLDELEDEAWNRNGIRVLRARRDIDKWLEENKKKLKQLENLQQAIVVNSKNHREKIIAVDSETFKIEW